MFAALSFMFLYLLPAIGGWKIFEKAGVAGWAALIPVLNWFGVLKVLGLSYLWIVAFVFFYPVAHVVSAVMLAWKFGRGTLFGLGLAFLPGLFVPWLGFSNARYLGR
jgi:hypothetical protein